MACDASAAVSRHAGPIVWVVAVLALLAAPAAAQVIGPVPPSAARMPETPGMQPPLQAPFTLTPTASPSTTGTSAGTSSPRSRQAWPSRPTARDITCSPLYSFRADVYARDESRSFFLSSDTNLVAQEGAATGRIRS